MTITQTPLQRIKSTLLKSLLAVLIIGVITVIWLGLQNTLDSLISLKFGILFTSAFLLIALIFLAYSNQCLTLDINDDAIVISYADKSVKLNWNDAIRITTPTIFNPRWTFRGPDSQAITLLLFDFTRQQIAEIARQINRHDPRHLARG